MLRTNSAGTLAVLLIAMLAGVALASDQASTQAKPVPTTQPCSAPQPTHLQFEVYQLTCTQERAADFNLAQVTAGPAEPVDILERLSQIGDTKLIHRLDTVSDIRQEWKLSEGQRVPFTEGVKVLPDGRTVPRFSYRNVGITIRIIGQWRDDQPDRADIICDMEMKFSAESTISVANNIILPISSERNFNRALSVRDGQPSYALLIGRPGGPEADAPTVVTLVRLLAARK